MIRWFGQLTSSIKRFPQILFHPATYFPSAQYPLLDSVVVISLLFLVTLFQKLLWIDPSKTNVTFGWVIEQAAVNSLFVWSVFTSIFYAILAIFKKTTALTEIFGRAGSVGLPLAISTFLSVISLLFVRIIHLPLNMPVWLTAQNILSWLGLAMSWPGLFGYFLLYHGYKLKRTWAALIPGLLFILFITGWILPSL